MGNLSANIIRLKVPVKLRWKLISSAFRRKEGIVHIIRLFLFPQFNQYSRSLILTLGSRWNLTPFPWEIISGIPRRKCFPKICRENYVNRIYSTRKRAILKFYCATSSSLLRHHDTRHHVTQCANFI